MYINYILSLALDQRKVPFKKICMANLYSRASERDFSPTLSSQKKKMISPRQWRSFLGANLGDGPLPAHENFLLYPLIFGLYIKEN